MDGSYVNTSFAGHQTPRKQPRESESADYISAAQLGRTPEGRAATFESRAAIQRELDGTRSVLKGQERSGDDLRRQAVTAREEAAVYKAENLRLQDEIRSCKARMNSLLDTQAELLRKNADKHDELLESQRREAKVRDELASRAGLVDYYTSNNQQLEHQLGEVVDRAKATEDALRREVHLAEDEIRALQTDLTAKHNEASNLHATVEALRAELDRKDALLEQKAATLAARDRERHDMQHELRAATKRISELTEAQGDIRGQLSATARAVEDKETELRALRATNVEASKQLSEKNAEMNRILVDKLELERTVSHSNRILEARIAAARAAERLPYASTSYLWRRDLNSIIRAEEEEERLEALKRARLARTGNY